MPIYAIIILILGLPITLYSCYVTILGLFGLLKTKKFDNAKVNHKFCCVVACRNEKDVIGGLIDSLKKQNYPSDKIVIYAAPNNCTDETEQVALDHGANIYTCKNPVHCKGDVLKEFFPYILEHDKDVEAVCVFDADNIVADNFIFEMNKVLDSGAEVAQSYRDSKNPKESWMSGCQSIYFWIMSRFVNRARRKIGLSSFINGTGYMVSRSVLSSDIINTETMTEDLEFSLRCIFKGKRIEWVQSTRVYDEQPIDFKTAWHQRRRWSSGMILCTKKYLKRILTCHKKGSFDALMSCLAPLIQMFTLFYTIVTITSTVILLLLGKTDSFYLGSIKYFWLYVSIISNCGSFLASIIGPMLVVKIEGKKIRDVNVRTFLLFWFYLLSWMLVNTICFFKPSKTWKPITHKSNAKIE